MFCLKKLKNILQSNYLLILLVIITVFNCCCVLNRKLPNKEDINSYELEGIVTKIQHKKEKIELEIKEKSLFLAVFYKDNEELEDISLGDKVKIVGTLKTPSENTNFNLFNYRKYLMSKKISYIINIY